MLRSKFMKRTMGRLMRQLDESMYPSQVQDIRSLGAAIGSWEENWKIWSRKMAMR